MRITAITSTELFVGAPDNPLQVLRVAVDQPATQPLRIEVSGDGVSGSQPLPAGQVAAEVGVRRTAPPGAVLPVTVTVHRAAPGAAAADPAAADPAATADGELVVAEPGWTVWMVPHFHYDPVWWNTQAAYTATWDAPGQLGGEFRSDFQQTGFELVRLHLETARRDPDYRFVLAELDYLKPYWDSHPADRAYLRHLIDAGRVELMGGTYNEPNTNLVSAESTIRNLVYGSGFQRDIVGGDPRTAWQLDAFGHDPQFPGLVAEAGLDSSSWARGPFHQWGPMLWTHAPDASGWGDPSSMQFCSEFDWLSPSGRGVLTHYMPAHYSAGWHIDGKPTLAEAEHSVYHLFLLLKKVAATRNVLLPVGTDYTPPAKWVTDIHRDWNARYAWPRFVCGLPREFFGAVRHELEHSGRGLSPQTRDMNPVYTGKDVSYIDTKQAQRHVEAMLSDAETFATIAASRGAAYPHAAVDRAWRQLVYGAHHDAITGSESDQVYLDLLTGWREAHDLAGAALGDALGALAGGGALPVGGLPADAGTPAGAQRIVVFNPSSWARTDLVRARVTFDRPGTLGVTVRGPDGSGDPPVLLEHPLRHADGSLAGVDVVFLAAEVPAVGYRPGGRPGGPSRHRSAGSRRLSAPRRRSRTPPTGWWSTPTAAVPCPNWSTAATAGRCSSRAAPATSWSSTRSTRHTRFHEGPLHLLPKGAPVHGSAGAPAGSVRVDGCPLGERITVTGRVGPVEYTQQLTLWHGIDRVDATTTVERFTGTDQLVRLRWPMAVPGALPVSEVAHAAVGRGFGVIDVDSADAPWTLDNPAQHWFALSATATVDVCDPEGTRLHTRAIGVAEIIAPAGRTGEPGIRDLAVGLIRRGVSATCSTDTGPRYGTLAVDSNLPDVRIAVGGPEANAYTAEVLAGADPGYAVEVARQLAATGGARVWVPAARALREVWVPNADLTGPRTLPVLIVAGAAALAALRADVVAGTIGVRQPAALSASADPDLVGYTVGLINRGIPGFAVDTSGALHLSLLRSCTGWPSGVWIDPPRRTMPDSSTFQQQHWTHSFDYALVTEPGDWRDARLVAHGHDVNHPLRVMVGQDLAATDDHPDAMGYLSVRPAGQVMLSALKPAGNPMAVGAAPRDTVDEVTVRLYEATGQPAGARVGLWAPVTGVHDADLLERPRGSARTVDGDELLVPLDGAAIGQWTLRVPSPAGASAAGASAADRPGVGTEPVYARYWLHNTGPAPAGNLPVAVHVEPAHQPVTGPVTLPVTVASDRTDAPVTGRLDDHPEGRCREPSTMEYHRSRAGHTVGSVRLTPPGSVTPGVYWARLGSPATGAGRGHHLAAGRGSGPERWGGHPDHARGPAAPRCDRRDRGGTGDRRGHADHRGGAPDQPVAHLGPAANGVHQGAVAGCRPQHAAAAGAGAARPPDRPVVGAAAAGARRPAALHGTHRGRGAAMTDPSGPVAAWVGDRAIGVAEIDAREAALRSGPRAARLPPPDTAEGRNLRRWLVQAVTAEAVVTHEAALRGVVAAPDDTGPRPVTLRGALGVGGVAAAVLAALPEARALHRQLTPEQPVGEDEIRGYFDRNRDRHPEPYRDARPRIAAELAAAERDRHFARWLEQRHATMVRLAPGFEHPGDPGHPDATHRH
jgi:alpha-mannosidase